MHWISFYSYCSRQTQMNCFRISLSLKLSGGYDKLLPKTNVKRVFYALNIQVQVHTVCVRCVCCCSCLVLRHTRLCMQMGYSHYVPDDAGTVRAGSDTLFVVTLDFDTVDSGFVLLHGLQQPMATWLQLPNTHL